MTGTRSNATIFSSSVCRLAKLAELREKSIKANDNGVSSIAGEHVGDGALRDCEAEEALADLGEPPAAATAATLSPPSATPWHYPPPRQPARDQPTRGE
jgi:hypothetical protein